MSVEHYSIDEMRREIKAGSCYLVPLSFSHTKDVVRWRNDPEIARFFLTSNQFTAEGHEHWLQKALSSYEEVNWVILDLGRTPVGTVSLYKINSSRRSAEFGRLLVGEPWARGRGFAREAVEAVISVAKCAGIASLHLEVAKTNTTARMLYARCGFSDDEEQEHALKMSLSIAP